MFLISWDGYLVGTVEWWSGRRNWSLILVDPIDARRETISIGVSSIHPCNLCLYWGVTSVDIISNMQFFERYKLWPLNWCWRSCWWMIQGTDKVSVVVDLQWLSSHHGSPQLHIWIHSRGRGYTSNLWTPRSRGSYPSAIHGQTMTSCIEVSCVTRVTFIVSL